MQNIANEQQAPSEQAWSAGVASMHAGGAAGQAGTCLPAPDQAVHGLQREGGYQSNSRQLGCSIACLWCVCHGCGFGLPSLPVCRHSAGGGCWLPGGHTPLRCDKRCSDSSTKSVTRCKEAAEQRTNEGRATLCAPAALLSVGD